MAVFKTLLFLFFVVSTVTSHPSKPKVPGCGYETCHAIDGTKVNVHLVPHSHDDVGWLQTLDRYYFGTPGDRVYEHAGVQYIISSTMEALLKNPERRYIQVETAFFWKWWEHQDDVTKQNYRDLVESGQLEMINGAWSMNDEAAAHYHSTIDQFTWGFRILDDTIGSTCAKPKIGWQIDPFGHSREHASIVKQLGFEGLVIGRLDYRDKENRKQNKALDFLWQTSANLDNSNLFTSMFPNFYITESGFCWDVTCGDQPINDDPESSDYNVDEKVSNFAGIMDSYSEYYRTRNILIPMGGDFHFQGAEINFANIDKLIKGFENHPKYNVIYSTPSCYIKAVNDEVTANGLTLPAKTDDFFPYASDSHAYWTGYFTSRPASKRFERMGNNILQAAKQLTSFSRINGKNYDEAIVDLREAMGVMQHHDAITGTEKQFVADDYSRLLSKALKEAEAPMGVVIGDLLKKENALDVDLKLQTCWLANVSVCEPTNADRFMVAVYNPLAHVVSHYVRLPVGEGSYQITGDDGEEVYDLLTSISVFDYMDGVTHSPNDLVFKAKDLPPLGVKFYYVEKIDVKTKAKVSDLKDDFTYGTEINGFTLDPATNLLNSVTIQGQTLQVKQEFLYYTPAVGDNGGNRRSSGAYVFRPADASSKPFEDSVLTKSQKGQLVDEVIQAITEQIMQIIRVYKSEDDTYIEFDWLVGDLQVDEVTQTGIEIITKFTVQDFANEKIFFTDSNGREQIQRELNKRNDYDYDATEEPVTGNYYPITSKIVIKDAAKKLEVAVLNDRAQGGSSLEEGSIELMVHRRLLHDDAFGVNEALNEQQFGRGLYVRGQHYLTFGSTESNVVDGPSTAAKERALALRKLLAPWVLVADATPAEFSLDKLQQLINFKFEGLKASLPDNVHLLTFEPWKDDSFILRVEHWLEKGEDDTLSAPVTVNLNDLFSTFQIGEVQESTLGANELIEVHEKRTKLLWSEEERQLQRSMVAVDPSAITLNPMQIRTFIIKTSTPTKTWSDIGHSWYKQLHSYFFS